MKNLKRYFSFEVTIMDDKGQRRRFRASNYQSATRVKDFICTMPMRLDDGWNQIQFNLAEFTRRAYGGGPHPPVLAGVMLCQAAARRNKGELPHSTCCSLVSPLRPAVPSNPLSTSISPVHMKWSGKGAGSAPKLQRCEDGAPRTCLFVHGAWCPEPTY